MSIKGFQIGNGTVQRYDYNSLDNKPSVDATLSVTGAAADAKKTGDEINDLKSAIGDLADLETENKSSIVAAINDVTNAGGGISGAAKTFLIEILRNAIYVSEQSNNIVNLANALDSGGGSTVAIINTLSNCSNSNPAISAKLNTSYSATITADTGYEINSITIIMNEEDVTLDVYSSGAINIANVTGDIYITASAKAVDVYYALPNAVVFDGTNVYKTGVKLNSLIADGAASMFIDFTDPGTSGVTDGRVAWNIGNFANSYNGVHISGGTNNGGYYNFLPITAQETSAYRINASYGSGQNIKMMIVWERVSSVYQWTTYIVVDGELVATTSGSSSSFSVGNDLPLVLGGQITNSEVSAFSNYWIGTVNALRIYDSALPESSVYTLLGINSPCIYSLPDTTTFDGSSIYIDTGVKPCLTVNSNITIMADFTPNAQTYRDGSNILANLFCIDDVTSTNSSLYMDILRNANYRIFIGDQNIQNLLYESAKRTKAVIEVNGSGVLTYHIAISGENIITGTLTKAKFYSQRNLIIGAALKSNAVSRFFNGTIHDFKICSSLLTVSEINDYLAF